MSSDIKGLCMESWCGENGESGSLGDENYLNIQQRFEKTATIGRAGL